MSNRTRPGPVRLSVVCVHHHTPELVGPAAAAVRVAAQRAGFDLDFVVVDNGSDEAGRRLLEQVPGSRVLDRGCNLGYAGGANFGISRSHGEVLAVMNPDVLLSPDCLSVLREGLQAGAGCVGPAFTWDEGGTLLMPPAEQRRFADEVQRALSGWSSGREQAARRRWRRHAQRHWLAAAGLRSEALSGAFLMFRRDAWQRVGTFDEAFKLYFEETDWLLRARNLGVESRYMPSARAVHFFDQSASNEARSPTWFAESAVRFREKAYGRARALLIAGLERRRRTVAPALGRLSQHRSAGAEWLELSPDPRGFPAVGRLFEHGVPHDWQLPSVVRDRHPNLVLHGRVVSMDGAEKISFVLGPEAGGNQRGSGQSSVDPSVTDPGSECPGP